MKLTTRQRWGIYGMALALTLGAVLWVEREGDELVVASAQVQDEPPTAESAQAPAASRAPSALGIEGLPVRSHGGANGDPFSPRSWEEMAAEEARREAPPSRPVVPQPPPIPFTYMGKLIEGKETRVFLTRGEQHYIVRPGDTLEHNYRVEEIGEEGMVLTYLPLKRKQQLSFASAEAGGGQPGRARRARYQDDGPERDTGQANEEELDAAVQSGDPIRPNTNTPEQDDE